jgi:hypothetical protein
MHKVFYVSSIGCPNIANNLLILLTPLQNGYVPGFMQSPTVQALITTVQVVVLVGVAALAWYGASRAASTRMAIATLTSMVLSGPALVVLVFLASHTYTPIPSRYGLSLVGPAAACLAVMASRHRVGGLALTLLGAAGLAELLTATL